MDFVVVSGIPSNTIFISLLSWVEKTTPTVAQVPTPFCIKDILKREELASLLICLSMYETGTFSQDQMYICGGEG